VDAPIVIYCDNISNILLANNPIYHARTKHIEVHYHFFLHYTSLCISCDKNLEEFLMLCFVL
jgi:hypothetical protein